MGGHSLLLKGDVCIERREQEGEEKVNSKIEEEPYKSLLTVV